MSRADHQPDPAPPADLVFRSTPNWTPVLFFGLLAALHLAVAARAFALGRWQAFLSVGLGVLFAAVAACAARARWEVSVLPGVRTVRRRLVLWREWHRRDLPFARVTAVRLTLSPGGNDEARIEILSSDGDVECPPTSVPRQEALLLAMTMNVPLTRVSDGTRDGQPVADDADAPARLDGHQDRWADDHRGE